MHDNNSFAMKYNINVIANLVKYPYCHAWYFHSYIKIYDNIIIKIKGSQYTIKKIGIDSKVVGRRGM